MKEALLIIDCQNYIVNFLNNNQPLNNIKKLIDIFEYEGKEIIFIKNIIENNDDNIDLDLAIDTKHYPIFKKNKPNAFENSEILPYLKEKGIERIVIAGFNTEYCCMFTSIVGSYLGFKTTLIEDACGTTGDENSYEMPGLDINDFVGSVLNWSDYVEVLYYEEYISD